MSTGRARDRELAGRRDGNRDDDERCRGVADELTQDRGEHEEREQHHPRACITDDVDERVGEVLRGAGLLHSGRERDHGADEHDRRPRDAFVRLRHRHDPQQHHRAGSEQPRRRRRNGAGREEHDHGRHDPEAFERAWPECDRLASDGAGRVHRQHLRVVVDMSIERVPRTLNQQGVTWREHGLARACVLALALHRQDHQLAAVGHHAGEDPRPPSPIAAG